MRIAVLTRQIGNYHHARFTALAEASLDFAVVSLANEGNFAGFVSNAATDYEVYRLYDSKAAYTDAVREGRAARDVAMALDAIGADVVALAGWACAESFAGLRWAYDNGASIVMMSDSQAEDATRSSWREAIKRRIISYCDAGFVAGEAHGRYLASLGMDSERITMGYDVVDNAHFATGAQRAREATGKSELRASLGLPARPYFLASGRFIAKKNLPLLIETYAEIAANSGDCPDLCLLGDGEQRDLLEALIQKRVLVEKVHLLGLRPYDDLPAIYGLAEAFIHPALHEQWGLVVSEAGAAGLPLAVSRTAGAAQLVEEGENGILFDPADADDLKRALSQLAQMNPDERTKWGQRSAEIMSNWGPDRYVEGLTRAAELASKQVGTRGRPKAISWLDTVLISRLSRKIIMDVA
ncbi:glycosyltransferase [Erythrobacter alti]|uniref:glycosyltransferase n=1 Tax=Erythrobacter alti TaxID=1896145 RepID=UPI0030F40C94